MKFFAKPLPCWEKQSFIFQPPTLLFHSAEGNALTIVSPCARVSKCISIWFGREEKKTTTTEKNSSHSGGNRMVVYRALRFHFSFPPLALPFDLFRRTFFLSLLLGVHNWREAFKSWPLGSRMTRSSSINNGRSTTNRPPYSLISFPPMIPLALFSFIQNAACNDNTTFFRSRGRSVPPRRKPEREREKDDGDWERESVREFKPRWRRIVEYRERH